VHFEANPPLDPVGRKVPENAALHPLHPRPRFIHGTGNGRTVHVQFAGNFGLGLPGSIHSRRRLISELVETHLCAVSH
jgi:hypothetical protein